MEAMKIDMDRLVCRYYVVNKCFRGPHCLFPHIKGRFRTPDEICRLYLENRCSYGSHCKFLHVSYKNLTEFILSSKNSRKGKIPSQKNYITRFRKNSNTPPRFDQKLLNAQVVSNEGNFDLLTGYSFNSSCSESSQHYELSEESNVNYLRDDILTRRIFNNGIIHGYSCIPAQECNVGTSNNAFPRGICHYATPEVSYPSLRESHRAFVSNLYPNSVVPNGLAVDSSYLHETAYYNTSLQRYASLMSEQLLQWGKFLSFPSNLQPVVCFILLPDLYREYPFDRIYFNNCDYAIHASQNLNMYDSTRGSDDQGSLSAFGNYISMEDQNQIDQMCYGSNRGVPNCSRPNFYFGKDHYPYQQCDYKQAETSEHSVSEYFETNEESRSVGNIEHSSELDDY